MNDVILNRQRKAREFVVTVGDIRLKCLRPRKGDLLVSATNRSELWIFEDFVYGWEGVKESDLVPAGSSDLVDFDREVWLNLLYEREDLWEPLGTGFSKQLEAHEKRTRGAGKNS